MKWDLALISLYYWVCQNYENGGKYHAQRYSNNSKRLTINFTDEETLTLYLFGLQRHKTTKAIHQYAQDHLLDWFPNLPSYQKFNERLNQLSSVLEYLSEASKAMIELPEWLLQDQIVVDCVTDSMPIILAKGNRSNKAKVARAIANKGYCASKNLFYHGLKLHHLGLVVPKKMPAVLNTKFSPASENDNTFFKQQMAPEYRNIRVFADKIYHDKAGMELLKELFNIIVMPCQKRKKGQPELDYDQKLFSTAVSRIRQPIESFFEWLQEKTNIHIASKVRSTKGLLKHIFGRLTIAFLALSVI